LPVFVTPLHISGNTTPDQQEQLRDALQQTVQRVLKTSLKNLDQQSIQIVIELEDKLKAELTSAAHKIIRRLTLSDKYKVEETVSQREYPAVYRVKPIEAQVSELRKAFPSLGRCIETLARKPLPEYAEAWFAIPRWQALAPTYGEAVALLINVLEKRRKFSNRLADNLGPKFLRQNERARMAERILADQQKGSEILVVAAQLGLLHRGCSARRARVVMAGHEFGLGSFAMGCILLTHPERLSRSDTLMIDCSGDEYSLRADTIYDRVPLYDFDIGGIDFSVFYEDRARSLWGTPTGFTVSISGEEKKVPVIASAVKPQL
jgi:hypothetical protein